MSKKLISIIFIYILLTGCDTVMGPEDNSYNYYLEISAPDLVIDNNGLYIMTFNTENYQEFTTLKAETGSIAEHQLLYWISNKEYAIEWYNEIEWINLINSTSYTDDEGFAYGVLSSWAAFVGDTIKVYCGYEDNYGNQYLDSLGVIIQ